MRFSFSLSYDSVNFGVKSKQVKKRNCMKTLRCIEAVSSRRAIKCVLALLADINPVIIPSQGSRNNIFSHHQFSPAVGIIFEVPPEAMFIGAECMERCFYNVLMPGNWVITSKNVYPSQTYCIFSITVVRVSPELGMSHRFLVGVSKSLKSGVMSIADWRKVTIINRSIPL